MCDYSLSAVASRPAKVGETLVSTYFRGTPSHGFAVPHEESVAVCLLPGTELVFEGNVKYRGGWFRSKTAGYSVAKFCKIDPEIPHKHHDGLEFPDGSKVLVQSLVQGQRVRVLQMPITNKGHKSAGQQGKAATRISQELI
jgi:hypothetical protein